MLLNEALNECRFAVVRLAPEDVGSLRALADEQISRAIHLIHREPARRWTVNDLARSVDLSRSTLEVRFNTSVGLPPLQYVLLRRVRLADHALLNKSATSATVADALGYKSESAFSNAFKRVRGSSPSHYRIERSGTNGSQ